jgi:hypothetical protein
VSTCSPAGAITNSDLELAGGIGNQDVLVQEVDCRGRPTAGLPQALRRTFSASPACTNAIFGYLATLDYIQGSANTMVDDCLRLWHLNGSQLLA